jgi:hypothetical protein
MSPEFPRYGHINLETVAAKAVELILENGSHVPTLIVSGSEGNTVMLIEDLAPNHNLRMQQIAMFGFGFGLSGRVGKLEQIFMITEAWMSARKGDQLPIVSPSEDPERQEVLFISSLSPMQDQRDYAAFEMVRDSEGVLRELTRILGEDAENISAESPLLDAFVIGFQIGSGEIE